VHLRNRGDARWPEMELKEALAKAGQILDEERAARVIHLVTLTKIDVVQRLDQLR